MRKCLFLFLLSSLTIIDRAMAQKGDNDFDTTNLTLIDLRGRHILQTIQLDASKSFPLKTLPDTMIIAYTGDDYSQTRIVFFNKGKKDSLVIAFKGSGSNTEALQLSDFDKGKVYLAFAGSQLINIGNRERPIKPRSFLNWDTWVTIAGPPASSKPEAVAAADALCDKTVKDKQKILTNDTTAMYKAITCILCNKFPLCKDSASCSLQKAADTPKVETAKKRHTWSLFSGGEKTNRDADVYICVYDVAGGTAWYANSVLAANRIYDISSIHPKTWSEMKFIIKGNDQDEDYVVSADGQTFFMEGTNGLQGAISNSFGAPGNTADTVSTHNAADETQKQIDSSVAAVKATDTTLQGVDVKANRAARSLDTNAKLLQFSPRVLKKDQTRFLSLFNAQIKKRVDSMNKVKKPVEVPDNVVVGVTWKPKFMALDKILENFNHVYSSIDFKEKDYNADLATIQQGIKNCLHIPATSNPDDLRKALEVILCSEVAPENLRDCRLLIESITSEYKAALSKTTHRKMYYKEIQVPDADDVKVTITSKKNNTSILERSFHIRGGWKIDISSGIFYNGLGTGDYILSRSTFAYLETKDSFFVSNGVQYDSVHYTGKILDTTGNFIQRNNARINYGAGFFAHFYRRSGRAFDIGGGIGFQINNSGQALLMLGISPMIHTGSSRIAIIGGITFGKRTYLSAAAKPYVYQDYYKQFDQASSVQGTSVFQNRNALPRFYSTGTDLKVDTYDKIGCALFFGVTFNFASFSLSKK